MLCGVAKTAAFNVGVGVIIVVIAGNVRVVAGIVAACMMELLLRVDRFQRIIVVAVLPRPFNGVRL